MTKPIHIQKNLAEAAPAASATSWPTPVVDGRRFGYLRTLAGRHAG